MSLLGCRYKGWGFPLVLALCQNAGPGGRWLHAMRQSCAEAHVTRPANHASDLGNDPALGKPSDETAALADSPTAALWQTWTRGTQSLDHRNYRMMCALL